MKKGYYMPYGLDMEYEYRTYKQVGADYGNRKTANFGMFGNICRFFRRKRNKTEKKYAFCNTYSEWKRHVKDILPSDAHCNYEDIVHWLYRKRNNESSYLEAIKCILIPIYISLFTMIDVIVQEDIVKSMVMLSTLCIIVVFSSVIYYSAARRLQFYEDFIEVVEKNNMK